MVSFPLAVVQGLTWRVSTARRPTFRDTIGLGRSEAILASAKAPYKVDRQVKRPVKTVALAVKPASTRPELGTPPGEAKLTSKNGADQLSALKKAVHLEISNGAGRRYMAARMGRYLGGHGLVGAHLTNARSFTNKISVLYFKPGRIANAKSLSGVLPISPELRRNTVLDADLRLVLGGDLLNFDRRLISRFK